MIKKNSFKFAKFPIFISVSLNLILLLLIGNQLNYNYTRLFQFSNKVYNVENDPIYLKTKAARTNLIAMLPNNKNEIIFLGNSLIENFPLQEMFMNLDIKNRGVNGNTSHDILKRMKVITAAKPAKIFLMTGINDIYRNNENVDSAFQNIIKICKVIRKETPETKIYIQSILPVKSDGNINAKIAKLNSLISNSSKSGNFYFIDLHSKFIENNQINPIYTTDGVHLSEKGYFLWKKSIESFVYE